MGNIGQSGWDLISQGIRPHFCIRHNDTLCHSNRAALSTIYLVTKIFDSLSIKKLSLSRSPCIRRLPLRKRGQKNSFESRDHNLASHRSSSHIPVSLHRPHGSGNRKLCNLRSDLPWLCRSAHPNHSAGSRHQLVPVFEGTRG